MTLHIIICLMPVAFQPTYYFDIMPIFQNTLIVRLNQRCLKNQATSLYCAHPTSFNIQQKKIVFIEKNPQVH